MFEILFQDMTIVTMEDTQPVIAHGYLGVKDGKIAYLGETPPKESATRVIAGSRKVLMPGMINTHAHTAMSLLRGYADDYNLQDWLFQHVFPAEAKLTADAIYYGGMLGIAEMLRTGTTSVTDMYFQLPQFAEVVMESGMKANICNAIVAFDPARFVFAESGEVKESNEILAHYHMADGGRLRLDAGIHAEYTSYPEVWEQMAGYAKEHQLRMQLHLSETEKEHRECVAKYGMTPTGILAKYGVFDVPTTAAHGVWITPEDMELLAEKQVTIAHNPVSNLKLASGIANVQQMQQKGLNVSLGSDGVCSNNSYDLFEEMKLAAILQKNEHKNPELLPAYEALRLATVNGAKAQGREAECGTLKVGFDADVVMVDFDTPGLVPCHHVISSLVYSARGGDVALTMVKGRVLYEHGEFTTIDIEKVMTEVERRLNIFPSTPCV